MMQDLRDRIDGSSFTIPNWGSGGTCESHPYCGDIFVAGDGVERLAVFIAPVDTPIPADG